MKNKKYFIGILALLFALTSASNGQNYPKSKTATLAGDDVDAMELRSIVVENWEEEPWVAFADPLPPESSVEVKIVKGRPQNLAFDRANNNSLGLRFQFVYPGYNVVTLLPPASKKVRRYAGQLDENNKPKYYETPGIELPGKVKAISVWVLGRGNNYTLEGWIEDWKGDTHILNFGSLDFIGWRPLTVKIPENIPQDITSYPATKTLVFKRFVIRSTKHTTTEKVVLFFDTLKVLTDMYDLFFDGADMDFDEQDRQEKLAVKKYATQLKQKSATDVQDNGNTK